MVYQTFKEAFDYFGQNIAPTAAMVLGLTAAATRAYYLVRDIRRSRQQASTENPKEQDNKLERRITQ